MDQAIFYCPFKEKIAGQFEPFVITVGIYSIRHPGDHLAPSAPSARKQQGKKGKSKKEGKQIRYSVGSGSAQGEGLARPAPPPPTFAKINK